MYISKRHTLYCQQPLLINQAEILTIDILSCKQSDFGRVCLSSQDNFEAKKAVGEVRKIVLKEATVNKHFLEEKHHRSRNRKKNKKVWEGKVNCFESRFFC